MRISLIGYGKMGKAIERLAVDRGHEIVHKIDLSNRKDITLIDTNSTDVAIEFSQPETAYNNISTCLRNGVKVIAGTTGWLNQLPDISTLVTEVDGAFLYASNFSVGVNLFFEFNRQLAVRMEKKKQFNVAIEEIHHNEKLDSPSGTAINLASGILESHKTKKGWTNEKTTDQTKIGIISKREPNVHGTHTVQYSSEFETISIKHAAHDRDVFASGALDVAEWMQDKKGVLTYNDYLNETV